MADFSTDIATDLQTAIEDITAIGIHQAFYPYDASDYNSNTLTFKLPDTDIDVPEPIREGAVMPRSDVTYTKKEVTFDKFGFEVTESQDTADVLDEVERVQLTMATIASDVLYDELGVAIGDADDRSDIIPQAQLQARLCMQGVDVDTIIITELLAEAIANTDDENDWGDIRQALADEYDVDIVVDEYNVLRAGDVLAVDSTRMGCITLRTGPTVDEYAVYKEHDPRRQVDVPEDEREIKEHVAQAHLRLGHVVLDDGAGHIIRFGQL